MLAVLRLKSDVAIRSPGTRYPVGWPTFRDGIPSRLITRPCPAAQVSCPRNILSSVSIRLMGRVWRAPDALFGIVFLILAISNDWLVSRLGGPGDVCSVKLLNYLRSSPYMGFFKSPHSFNALGFWIRTKKPDEP